MLKSELEKAGLSLSSGRHPGGGTHSCELKCSVIKLGSREQRGSERQVGRAGTGVRWPAFSQGLRMGAR